MARRRGRRGNRRPRFRSARQFARAAYSRGKSIAREHSEDLEDMTLAALVGAAEGYIEADRVANGKPAAFQVGGGGDPAKAHNVTVGEIAALGGAAIALSSKNRKMARRAAAVGAGGAALTARKFAHDYRANKE